MLRLLPSAVDGDRIFAMFSAQMAHEDHPRRALYTEFRLEKEMTRYFAELFEGRMPIDASIGGDTGEVVVPSITGDGHTEFAPIVYSIASALAVGTAR
jgi:hypothetical protein